MKSCYLKSFLFLVFLSLSMSQLKSQLKSQGLEVTGRVRGYDTGEYLEGATVQMMGKRIFSTTTNKSGDFRFFPLPPGFYELSVSFVGYESYVLEYVEVASRKSFGDIKLHEVKTDIKEIVVEGKTSVATVNGDTVDYNADYYKTNPDANAEDLVAKMPGIIIEDGTIKAQGEDVKKVYVDGKPFFDQDPKLALKTLPAEVIQKIQIFDEQSEQAKFTGFDDGETTKVMNVVTRLHMRNGQFGRIYAGYGYDNKYQAGGNINFFNGDRRISIIAQSNNVNQQNFASEDLLGISSSSGGRGGRGGKGGRGAKGEGAKGSGGGGSSTQDFTVGATPGITTSQALGLNYSDQWSDKIKVSGSYFFNASDNTTVEHTYQQGISEVDSFNSVYIEDANSKSQNYNHRLSFKMEYEMNENDRLIIEPRISFQNNSSQSADVVYREDLDTLLNSSNNINDADRNGYSFSNRMTYMHKFEKKGRTISLSANQSLSLNNSESTQLYDYLGTDSYTVVDSLNQFDKSETNNKRWSERAVYTEPIGEHSQLMLSGVLSVSNSDNDRRVFNYDPTLSRYEDVDTFLSNVYESSYNTQQLGGAYMYRWDRNILMLKLDYERASLSSDQVFPSSSDISRTYHSVLPMLRFKVDLSSNRRLDLFYRTSTTSPSVSQLQNTIDNSDPLDLSSGNPYLKPSYSHNVMARYSNSNRETGTMFFVMANLQYTQDYVGNSSWYALKDTLLGDNVLLQQGGYFSQSVNADHSWSARCFTTYGVPLSFIRSNFNMNLGYDYSYVPGVYNNEDINTQSHDISAGLVLSSNISENVDFTLSSRTNYNSSNSSLLTTNNDYIKQKTELKLNVILTYGIVFRTSLASQYYYWTDSQNDESYILLNMELGKKIFKNQQGEIKLAVYDVLNQNTSYSRNVTDVYIQDVTSNVLQRYAMLSFTYRLRNFYQSKTSGRAH